MTISRKHMMLLGLIWATLFCRAQEPGKPKDPCPLARPQPLCTIANSQPGPFLQEISVIVGSEGFNADSVKWADGELQASRKDAGNSGNMDKIVIWLERDLQQPNSTLKVYLLYGRFESFFGSTETSKVVVDSTFEGKQIGKLKQGIVNRCLNGGNQ